MRRSPDVIIAGADSFVVSCIINARSITHRSRNKTAEKLTAVVQVYLTGGVGEVRFIYDVLSLLLSSVSL